MNRDKTIFMLGIVMTIFITAVSLLLFYQDTKHLENKLEESVMKEIPKVVVSTIEPISIDYKKRKVEVLNATKIKGLAKVYADKLTSIGYINVSVGNYEDLIDSNTLYAPSDFKEDLQKIGFDDYKYVKDLNNIKVIIVK